MADRSGREQVAVRRIYDEAAPGEGRRVLVDRLWPRGLAKEEAELDEWLKDVAPSTDLRIWYGHDPAKFAEFRRRYLAELTRPPAAAALDRLRGLARQGPVTLLTATREVARSHAAVLAGSLGTDRS